LTYAEAYPERLFALILAGVTTTRRSEIDWRYRGMAPLLPEEWSRFCRDVPDGAHDGDLVAAHYRRLFSTDDDTCFQAAKAWHDWEAASILIAPGASIPRRWSDPRYRSTRAQIITHYFHHHAWLAEGQLVREAHRLSRVSGILLQGRLDLEAPLVTAWELSEAWSGAKLVIVPNSAHSPSTAAMASAIVEATDAFLAIL
jgi:proline iminopeptidase